VTAQGKAPGSDLDATIREGAVAALRCRAAWHADFARSGILLTEAGAAIRTGDSAIASSHPAWLAAREAEARRALRIDP
jgi:hypothetical protein